MIHERKGPEGDPLYFPWKEKSYLPSSLDNIIKMWHSIKEVWKLMESNGRYDTVAVIRNDVASLTPLDVTNTSVDPVTHIPNDPTRTVTVPGFDKWPVSDRAIYGPYDAVKVWATQLFNLLEQHIQYMYQKHRGKGLHHERFFKYTIFPEMKRQFYRLKHPEAEVKNAAVEGVDSTMYSSKVTEEEDRVLLIENHPPCAFFVFVPMTNSLYLTVKTMVSKWKVMTHTVFQASRKIYFIKMHLSHSKGPLVAPVRMRVANSTIQVVSQSTNPL